MDQQTLVKQHLCEYLKYEFKNNYNKIQQFKPIADQHLQDVKNIEQNYTPDSDFDSSFKKFGESMNNYIPDLSSPNSTYFNELKTQLQQYDMINSNNILTKSMGISTIEQLDSLTTIPPTYVQIMSPNIMAGSFNSLSQDFPSSEFQMAKSVTFYDNNIKASNISGTLENVVNIGSNLVTNFPELVDLEEMDNIFGTLPGTISNMGLNANGCMSVQDFLQNMTGLVQSALDSIMQAVNGMMLMMNQIMDQLVTAMGQIQALMGCLNPLNKIGQLGGLMGGLAGFPGMNLSGMLTGSLSASLGGSIGGSLSGSIGIPSIGGGFSGGFSAGGSLSLPSVNASLQASVGGKISGMLSASAGIGGFASGGCGTCCGVALNSGSAFNINSLTNISSNLNIL